jgi:hypothetical protein
MTRTEMEAAAMAGRQVAGNLSGIDALALLRGGELTRRGAAARGLQCHVLLHGVRAVGSYGPVIAASCVYKPIRGERPLYDFPDGTLACREVAAHAVSQASGWDIVPPTVMRDGPFGEGMVQLWVETDESADIADLLDSDNPSLRRIAVLDAALNNADRKGGHLLPLPNGQVQGIDNGLCFAVAPKLRTILWRWRGQKLTDEECDVLARLRDSLSGELGEDLASLLTPEEIAATERRIDALLSGGRLPQPDQNRPAVPWPPY